MVDVCKDGRAIIKTHMAGKSMNDRGTGNISRVSLPGSDENNVVNDNV